MPAVGKSTIGVILAKTMARPFIDTDLIIQVDESMALQKIIDDRGLDYFLQIEEKVVLNLTVEDHIIATGGSVVYSSKAMTSLKENGFIVYLRASLFAIKKRLHNITTRGIAALKEQSIDDLYYERMSLYEKYADVIIDCDYLDAEDVVSMIVKHQ